MFVTFCHRDKLLEKNELKEKMLIQIHGFSTESPDPVAFRPDAKGSIMAAGDFTGAKQLTCDGEEGRETSA